MNTTTTIHGVFLDIFDCGVLLSGPSGIGKSEVALGLINQNHKLIADDSVQIEHTNEHKLLGSCPSLLQDFLEVRGLGIINIRALFGDNAIISSKQLELIIDVNYVDPQQMSGQERLKGMHTKQEILGIDVRAVTIPVAPGRNLAILIETAVRDHKLKCSGYDASEQFIHRQHQTHNHYPWARQI